MPNFESAPRPPFGTVLLEKDMPSEDYYKERLIERVLQALKASGCLSRPDERKVHAGLDEAISNAMRHGNGSDPEKRVRLRLFADDSRWAVVVEDEGTGMKPEEAGSLSEPASHRRESGRGIRIMESHFDEVVYMGCGNQLLLARRRSAPDPEAVREALADAPLAMDSPSVEATPVPSASWSESDHAFEVVDAEGDDEYLSADSGLEIAGELESSTDTLRAVRVRGVRLVELLASSVTERNVEAVKTQLAAAAAGEKILILHLGRVEYVSSVALGAFVGLANQIEAAGGVLRLCSIPPILAELLDTTGVAALFAIYPDHRAALAG